MKTKDLDLIAYVRGSKPMRNIDGGCGWTLEKAKECRQAIIKTLQDYDILIKAKEKLIEDLKANGWVCGVEWYV